MLPRATTGTSSDSSRRDSDDGYEPWLKRHFARHTSIALAEHHHEFWRWVWGIGGGDEAAKRPREALADSGVLPVRSEGLGDAAHVLGRGVRAEQSVAPFVAIWPRGGAKSTSAELAVVAVAARQTRRYCLYVSGTQEQANKHVQSISAMFESVGGAQYAERRLGRYGYSRGWTQGRLRTASGFAVDAIGLDQSIRGTRDEANRPDFIVLDDIDAIRDHDILTQQKLDAITRDILPAGADGTVVLAIQNLVSERGVFAQLASATPPFLSGRTLSGPIPAVRDLVLDGDRIVGGEPTWKSLELCQADIDAWGLEAWLAECQHEVGIRLKEGLVYGEDDDGVLRYDPRLNVRAAPCSWRECKWRLAVYDPGGDDPSGIVGIGVTHDERIHVYKIEKPRGAFDDTDVHELWAQWHKEAPITRAIKDTAGGKNTLTWLQRNGWPIFAADKDRTQMATVQKLFKSRRLTVDPSVAHLVQHEVDNYWFDRRGDRTRHSADEWATRTCSCCHGEILDCIRYGVVAILAGLPGVRMPAGQVSGTNGPRLRVLGGSAMPGARVIGAMR